MGNTAGLLTRIASSAILMNETKRNNLRLNEIIDKETPIIQYSRASFYVLSIFLFFQHLLREKRGKYDMGQMPPRAIIGLLWAVASMGVCQQAWAQDARAVIDKTLRAYQSMNSYAGKTSIDADIITPNGSKRSLSAQSSALQFTRPNKIALRMNSSKVNIEIYGDGKTLTVYKVDAQKYYSLPSPPDMAGILIMLHDRFDIDAVLDPLFFLSSPTLPSAIGSLKMAESTKINGHEALAVTGLWEGKPISSAGKTNVFCTKGARWTIYIDRSNALLQKVEARIAGKINVSTKHNGKSEIVPMAVTLVMQHVIIEAKPNAPVNGSAFTFNPPKGATEQKDVKQLLEGSTGYSL